MNRKAGCTNGPNGGRRNHAIVFETHGSAFRLAAHLVLEAQLRLTGNLVQGKESGGGKSDVNVP